MYKIVEERFQGLYQKYCEAEDPMTEYDYYLTAVKEDGVSLFDVPYVYQTNELIMIALEVHRDRYVGSLVYRESVVPVRVPRGAYLYIKGWLPSI